MSIILKGIELPKDIGDIISINLYDKKDNWLDNIEVERKDIIEIPTPHGRLIDGDVLKEECYKTMDKLMESTSINISAEALSLLCGFTLIDDTPTILEAEGR